MKLAVLIHQLKRNPSLSLVSSMWRNMPSQFSSSVAQMIVHCLESLPGFWQSQQIEHIFPNKYSMYDDVLLHRRWSHDQNFSFCLVQLQKILIHPLPFLCKVDLNVIFQSFPLKCHQELFDQLMIISKTLNIELGGFNMLVEGLNVDFKQNRTEK